MAGDSSTPPSDCCLWKDCFCFANAHRTVSHSGTLVMLWFAYLIVFFLKKREFDGNNADWEESYWG